MPSATGSISPLPDDHEDFRDLHDARRVRRGAPAATTRFRTMIAPGHLRRRRRPSRGFAPGPFGLSAVLCLAFITAGCGAAPGSPQASGDLALIDKAMQQVEKSYVVPVRSDKLVDNALKGMLTRLDPHSDYMNEREYQELLATTAGEFGGVGIEISIENGVPQVIGAIEGTPAAAAGVEPGDRIVKANGEPIIGLEISEVVRRLRGSPGTPVVLTIARANRPSFDVPITRAVIHVDSVKPALKPGRIGYVRITTFNENTPATLRAALARLTQQAGGRLAGLVLDLRNDAGGLLDASIEVAGGFLDSGTIVSTRGRRPDENRVFEARRTAILSAACRWSC